MLVYRAVPEPDHLSGHLPVPTEAMGGGASASRTAPAAAVSLEELPPDVGRHPRVPGLAGRATGQQRSPLLVVDLCS